MLLLNVHSFISGTPEPLCLYQVSPPGGSGDCAPPDCYAVSTFSVKTLNGVTCVRALLPSGYHTDVDSGQNMACF